MKNFKAWLLKKKIIFIFSSPSLFSSIHNFTHKSSLLYMVEKTIEHEYFFNIMIHILCVSVCIKKRAQPSQCNLFFCPHKMIPFSVAQLRTFSLMLRVLHGRLKIYFFFQIKELSKWKCREYGEGKEVRKFNKVSLSLVWTQAVKFEVCRALSTFIWQDWVLQQQKKILFATALKWCHDEKFFHIFSFSFVRIWGKIKNVCRQLWIY
jgi:hypothetical protein